MNESETMLEEHPADFIELDIEEIDGQDTGRSLIKIWQNGKQVCALAAPDEIAETLYIFLGHNLIELLPAQSTEPVQTH